VKDNFADKLCGSLHSNEVDDCEQVYEQLVSNANGSDYNDVLLKSESVGKINTLSSEWKVA
jgi:hypothetical protein